MKIHIAPLLVLIFFMGGVTTACTADTSAHEADGTGQIMADNQRNLFFA